MVENLLRNKCCDEISLIVYRYVFQAKINKVNKEYHSLFEYDRTESENYYFDGCLISKIPFKNYIYRKNGKHEECFIKSDVLVLNGRLLYKGVEDRTFLDINKFDLKKKRFLFLGDECILLHDNYFFSLGNK